MSQTSTSSSARYLRPRVVGRSASATSPLVKGRDLSYNYHDTRKFYGTQRFLRWPLLLLIFLVILLTILFYGLLRLIVLVYELLGGLCCSAHTKHFSPKWKMDSAVSFDQWCEYAQQSDHFEKRDKWKTIDRCPFYDYDCLSNCIKRIHNFQDTRDWKSLLGVLREVYNKNITNMLSSNELYSQTHFGTKNFVHSFISEVVSATKSVMELPESQLSLALKKEFLSEAYDTLGFSGLFLSGGSRFGLFHFGVVRCLLELGLLPRIISGASAGAYVASWLAVRDDNECLQTMFDPTNALYMQFNTDKTWLTTLKRWYQYHYYIDWKDIVDQVKVATKGDTTFREAYEKTGRLLNISTTSSSKHGSPLMLNYRSAPNVVIWSAVIASSALPYIFEPIELYFKDENGYVRPWQTTWGKQFFDASIKCDCPTSILAREFNISFSIVSQCNPHVIPFFYYPRGCPGEPSPHHRGSFLRGGFVLSALENWMRLELVKWIQLLTDLDFWPAFKGIDWRFFWLQSFDGDVTIIPKDLKIRDFWKLLANPTVEDLSDMMSRGEKGVWPKIAKISNHFIFESSLANCAKKLDLNISLW